MVLLPIKFEGFTSFVSEAFGLVGLLRIDG